MFLDNALIDEGDFVHLALFADVEPVKLEQAVKERTWCEAMKEEIRSIKQNKTWELVDLLIGKKPIDVKWVYKTKLRSNEEVEKYKARLVARGFLQRVGLDYKEVFALVARIETIKLLVSLAIFKGWGLHQLDVKSTFLNGALEEEVYVTQPPRFVKTGEEFKVLRLYKASYALKQAPRA